MEARALGGHHREHGEGWGAVGAVPMPGQPRRPALLLPRPDSFRGPKTPGAAERHLLLLRACSALAGFLSGTSLLCLQTSPCTSSCGLSSSPPLPPWLKLQHFLPLGRHLLCKILQAGLSVCPNSFVETEFTYRAIHSFKRHDSQSRVGRHHSQLNVPSVRRPSHHPVPPRPGQHVTLTEFALSGHFIKWDRLECGLL